MKNIESRFIPIDLQAATAELPPRERFSGILSMYGIDTNRLGEEYFVKHHDFITVFFGERKVPLTQEQQNSLNDEVLSKVEEARVMLNSKLS